MPQRRYASPDGDNHLASDALPLNTVVTILPRQSTKAQRARHASSVEVNPEELRREAERWGFAPDHIRLVEDDMGIGAYSTVIDDRPGLRRWLREWLPSGESRVLLVSMEDRLFRDKWEEQHNIFIREVAQHGGWVICGRRVYNFRHESDREEFRAHCRFGKQYIEHQILERLVPATHRAALTGRYVGGPMPWGYIVDYDKHSPTFRHFLRYEPHATLVIEQVFRRFAAMITPSVMQLAQQWQRDGLVLPFFGPEVDERRHSLFRKLTDRYADLGGYPLSLHIAQNILSNVAYLGWRVHSGEVAWDVERKAPSICHEPLLEADLFWWCYDHIVAERPTWAPSKEETGSRTVSNYRPHRSRTTPPDEVRFLAPGRVRCAIHGARFSLVGPYKEPTARKDPTVRLVCASTDRTYWRSTMGCPVAAAPSVESALVQAFVEQLSFNEDDVQALAQVAEARKRRAGGDVTQLRQQLDEQRVLFERAKRHVLQVDDDAIAGDFLDAARRAAASIADLERRITEAQAAQAPSSKAWHRAERALHLAERIRDTFPYWPRQAQAQVLALALHEAVLGRIDRHSLGLWMQWEDDTISRATVASKWGSHQPWSSEEDQALRENYERLAWDALCTLLPGRTANAIETHALQLGLHRRRSPREHLVAQAVVTPIPENAMAAYGFPLPTSATPGLHVLTPGLSVDSMPSNPPSSSMLASN